MAGEANKKYFVRVQGKVMGPFSLAQLSSLKERDRLREDHEVSTDRRQWMPASQLEGVFALQVEESSTSVIEPVLQPVVEIQQAPQIEETQWYYSRGTSQQGPVTFEQLKRLVRGGEIHETHMVWHGELDDWIRAGDVPKLFDTRGAAAPRRSQVATSGGAAYVSPKETVVWDAVLGAVRSQIPGTWLDRAIRLYITVGSIAMSVAMLCLCGSTVLNALDADSLRIALNGILLILGVSVLRYAGVQLTTAGESLIKASPRTALTPAFFNSVAVLSVFLAVSGGIYTAFAAVDEVNLVQRIAMFVTSGQLVMLFLLQSLCVTHPSSLAIEVSETAGAGQEGIAVLSFLLKMLMRMMTLVFGLFAIVGAGCFAIAIGCSLAGKEYALLSFAFQVVGAGQLLLAGLCPLLGYLLFVMGSISLDVAQSIIVAAKAVSER